MTHQEERIGVCKGGRVLYHPVDGVGQIQVQILRLPLRVG